MTTARKALGTMSIFRFSTNENNLNFLNQSKLIYLSMFHIWEKLDICLIWIIIIYAFVCYALYNFCTQNYISDQRDITPGGNLNLYIHRCKKKKFISSSFFLFCHFYGTLCIMTILSYCFVKFIIDKKKTQFYELFLASEWWAIFHLVVKVLFVYTNFPFFLQNARCRLEW